MCKLFILSVFNVKHSFFDSVAALQQQDFPQAPHGSVRVAGQDLAAQGSVLLGSQTGPGPFQLD
jgi:hypothetical protein